jgi:hypothetical protein
MRKNTRSLGKGSNQGGGGGQDMRGEKVKRHEMRKNTSSKDNGFQPRRGEMKDMRKNTWSQDKGSNQGKDAQKHKVQ